MEAEFTAVYSRVPEGFVAFVEELPGANTQGETLDEARANLAEAVQLVLQANRELAEKELEGVEAIREPIRSAVEGQRACLTSGHSTELDRR